MAQIRSSSAELIAFFETGDIPTSDNFIDLIKSFAVYDGTLPLISGSSTSTGSFARLKIGDLTPHQSSDTIAISASLSPVTNIKHNLGTNTKKYREIHVQTASLDVFSSSIIPVTGSIYNIGSSTNKFLNIFSDGVSTLATSSIDIISSSLIPREDNTIDLGSSDREWKDLYVNGVSNLDTIGNGVSIPSISSSINISGSIIPLTTNTYNLGSSTVKWKDLHISGTANIGTLAISALDNGVSVTGISSSTQILELSGSLIPFTSESLTNSIYDLGSTQKKWNNLFLSGTASIDLGILNTGSFNVISSSLIPYENNSYDLGSSSMEWKDLYMEGTASLGKVDISGKGVITTASISKVSSSLEPDATDTYNLGSSTLKWENLHLNGTASLGKVDISGKGVITTASISKVSSSLIPDSDGNYNLGSLANEWKDLFLKGTANIDLALIDTASLGRISSNLIPTLKDIYSVGSNDFNLKNIHASTASISTLSSSLEPDATDTYNLGSENKKYKNIFLSQTASIGQIGNNTNLTSVFSDNVMVGSLIPTGSEGFSPDDSSGGNIDVGGNFIPSLDITYSLGIDNVAWKTLFVTDITSSGTITANKLIVTQFTASQVSANSITGSNQFGSSSTDLSSFSGSISAVTNITASGGISASGAITSGDIISSGFIQSNGMGNNTTISSNTTVPSNFVIALFVSTATPDITINSGVSYTISSGADVTLVNLSNFL